jgi:hypothetical protein
MVSTRHLDSLPDILTLRRLLQSLATLDAILSPDWEGRYYSFNSKWAEAQQMGSMRNGSGDDWFVLFNPGGVGIVGLAHEAPMFRRGAPWPGIFQGVPPELADLSTEPAFEPENSTFCVWRRIKDASWSRGPVEFPPGDDPDGSAELLGILEGDPLIYYQFAVDYYGVELPQHAIRAIYAHLPLTNTLVRLLNPVATLDVLANDLNEIDYPRAAG